MKMWCLTNDKDISDQDAVEITLEQALEEIDTFPSLEEYNGPEGGPFIGFVNEKEEVIQFSICEGNSWLLDIPVLKKGEFAFSLNTGLNILEVKNLIISFFEGSSNIFALVKIKKDRAPIKEIQKELSREAEAFSELMQSYYFLVDKKGNVVCDFNTENIESAKSVLSNITKGLSLRLVSGKELIEKHK